MNPTAIKYETKPLKRLAKLRVSNVDKKSVDGEIPVRLCNYTDVYYADVITDRINFMVATATAEEIAKFRLKLGDVIITKDSEEYLDIGVPAYVATEAPDLLCGYHLAILRPDPEEVNPRYLFWAFASGFVSHQLSVAATGLTRFGLRQDSIASAVIPYPSLDIQRSIADFLDRETERIDTLMEKKRRLIELLEEKRTALISHVVTKGLDPAVQLKDSNIKAIGLIPSHWRIAPVWILFRLGRGRVISQIEIDQNPGPYPVYSSQTANDGVFGKIATFDFEGEYLIGRQTVRELARSFIVLVVSIAPMSVEHLSQEIKKLALRTSLMF